MENYYGNTPLEQLQEDAPKLLGMASLGAGGVILSQGAALVSSLFSGGSGVQETVAAAANTVCEATQESMGAAATAVCEAAPSMAAGAAVAAAVAGSAVLPVIGTGVRVWSDSKTRSENKKGFDEVGQKIMKVGEEVEKVHGKIDDLLETVRKGGESLVNTVGVNTYAAVHLAATDALKQFPESPRKRKRPQAEAEVKVTSTHSGDDDPLTDLQNKLLTMTLKLFQVPTNKGIRDLFNFVNGFHPDHPWAKHVKSFMRKKKKCDKFDGVSEDFVQYLTTQIIKSGWETVFQDIRKFEHSSGSQRRAIQIHDDELPDSGEFTIQTRELLNTLFETLRCWPMLESLGVTQMLVDEVAGEVRVRQCVGQCKGKYEAVDGGDLCANCIPSASGSCGSGGGGPQGADTGGGVLPFLNSDDGQVDTAVGGPSALPEVLCFSGQTLGGPRVEEESASAATDVEMTPAGGKRKAAEEAREAQLSAARKAFAHLYSLSSGPASIQISNSSHFGKFTNY